MATKANIKMYRLNELGDCFLLTFVNGKKKSHLLIDCGSFRNGDSSRKRMKEVAADIKKQLKGAPLDAVIGTHQHNDHLSGFVHGHETFVSMDVEQVWLPWLDNPKSKTARKIGDAHNNLRDQVFKIGDKLSQLKNNPAAQKASKEIEGILGFYGAAPRLPEVGVKILKELGKKPVGYLKPGEIIPLPGMSKDDVRIYVLGPSLKTDDLYNDSPTSEETYDHKLTSSLAMSGRFLSALNNHTGEYDPEEAHYPFNSQFRADEPKAKPNKDGKVPDLQILLQDYYRKSDLSWRAIDGDWMQQSGRLALYLDKFTNNSSLAVAIELVDSGRVLLFPGDAQTGNWSSWENIKWPDKSVSLDDLLARTVLYKVGHHGSHNATLRPALEKMTHPDLIAMIPVDKRDENISKPDGWKMPAANLFKRLVEKTNRRVLRMDDVYAAGCNPATNTKAKASWKASGVKVTQNKMYVEVEL